MPMSFAGRAASSSGCAIGPQRRGNGLTGFAGRTRTFSHTGHYAMATAEHREPCESRGSRTVLGAPGVQFLRATRQQRTYVALSIQPVASALAHMRQPLLLAISAAAAQSYGTYRMAVDQPARVRSRMA